MTTATATRGPTPGRAPRPDPTVGKRRAAPVRLSPAPSAEPPYDRARARPAPPVQAALALTFSLPSGVPAGPPTSLHPGSPPVRPPAAAPEAEVWASRLARGIVEVIEGDRPVTQLVHWTAPRVYAGLCHRVATVASVCSAVRLTRPRAVARRVHVCRPAPHVAEVAVAVHGPDRTWAMAFRLELRAGHWLCTELLLG